LPFSEEQLCDLLKCKKIAILKFTLFYTFAHFQRENVQQNVRSYNRSFEKRECAKNVRFLKFLKRAIAHFRSVRLSNPGGDGLEPSKYKPLLKYFKVKVMFMKFN